jgi:hypothetical protein
MINTNTHDYSFDYFKKNSEEQSIKEVKDQYNPYVNNSGTVMCKIIN